MREPRLLGRAVMKADHATVSVRAAGGCERPLIENLSQFYIYDFSEMETASSSRIEFGDHGLYPPLPDIDLYWRIEGFRPLLIHVRQRLAGFILINTRSHRGGSVEHNMAEFFVARKHRRRGVATEALRQILARYPGRWEVAVAERNAAAMAFWPHAITAVPNICRLVRFEGDGEHWRGPIWSFRTVPCGVNG
jgi:predicted acetyltransferase